MSSLALPRRRPRILLGVSGSVAAVKQAELAVALSSFADVRAVATARAAHFTSLGPDYDGEAWAAFAALQPPVQVLVDADEWGSYTCVGRDAVLHIEVRAR